MTTANLSATENDVCQVDFVDEERVRRVREAMTDEETIYALVDTFRALADPTRARIIHALSREELCVCDLAHLVNVSASAVSHQLRLLRFQRLVRYRKSGRMVYYSLDDDHIHTLYTQALDHVRDHYHLSQGR